MEEYLAIGEAPEQVRNCFQQRSRWCKVSRDSLQVDPQPSFLAQHALCQRSERGCVSCASDGRCAAVATPPQMPSCQLALLQDLQDMSPVPVTSQSGRCCPLDTPVAVACRVTSSCSSPATTAPCWCPGSPLACASCTAAVRPSTLSNHVLICPAEVLAVGALSSG